MQYCNISYNLLSGVFTQCKTPEGNFNLEQFKEKIKDLNSNIDDTNGISEDKFIQVYKEVLASRNFRNFILPLLTRDQKETLNNLENIKAWAHPKTEVSDPVSNLEQPSLASETSLTKVSTKWLNAAWGYNTQALDAFLRQTRSDFNDIISKKGVDITNQTSLNLAIQNFYREKLYSIANYLSWASKDLKKPELEEDAARLRQLTEGLWGSTQQTNWVKIKEILDTHFSTINENLFRYYTGKYVSSREIRLQKQMRAYGDYLMIQPTNFDSLIRTQLKGIRINHSPGKLTQFVNKYIYEKTSSINTWQEEDSYSIARGVSDLCQVSVMSWKMWRKQGNTWVESSFEHPANIAQVFTTMSKIYKLGSSPKAKNIIIDSSYLGYFRDCGFDFGESLETQKIDGTEFVIPRLTNLFNKYFQGKSLAEIVSSIQQDPLRLTPMIMALLAHPQLGFETTFKKDYKAPNEYGFDSNDRAMVYTIWKNMFDPKENSVNNPVLYTFLMQSFLTHDMKSMYGIKFKDGEPKKAYYSQGKTEKSLNNLQLRINGLYPPTLEKKFKYAEITTDLEHNLVTIKSGDFSIQIKNGKVSVFHNRQEIKNNDNASQVNLQEALDTLTPFFQEALALDFSTNVELPLMEAYLGILNGSKYTALSNLANITGQLIYAYEVSKQYIDEDNSSDFLSKVREHYDKKDKINLVNGITDYQIDVFKNIFAQVYLLSLANDAHNKVVGEAMVKDGFGNPISSEVLTSLTTKYPQFVGEKCSGDSIIKDFSLHKILKEISFYRDYVDASGNIKAATGMSVEELFLSNFLYGFYSPSNTQEVMLGVFSDKPNLGRIELYKDQTVEVNGQSKNLSSLTIAEIKTLATKELGEFYLKMYNNMQKQLNILNKYLPANIQFNMDTDYSEVNAAGYTKSQLLDYIHQAIVAAQNNGEDIQINDLLYFYWDKDQVHVRPTIIAELYRAGYIQNTEFWNSKLIGLETDQDFWFRKETEFVTSLLQDLPRGISLVDSNGEPMNSESMRLLLENNPRIAYKDGKPDFKTGWATNRALVLGKFLYGDEVHILTTKEDLKSWPVYRNTLEYIRDLGLDTSEFDINDRFNLKKFLSFVAANYQQAAEHHKYTRAKSLATKFLTEYYKNHIKTLTKNQKQEVADNYRKFILEGIELGYYDRQLEAEGYTKDDFEGFVQDKITKRMEAYEEEPAKMISAYAHAVAESTPMESIQDIKKAIQNKRPQNKNSLENTLLTNLKEELDKKDSILTDLKFEVNPELAKYNTLGYMASEEGLNSLVGSHVNHEVKGPYNPNVVELNSAEVSAQSKRNVSLSSAKNQYLRTDPRGVGKTCNLAIIEDTYGHISTINGIEDKKGTKPQDGATYGNYIYRKQELFSLGSQRAGIDNSKPIGNDLNPDTGTGTIVKTAVFVLTNQRIRTSKRNIDLHRKMNHIPWKHTKGFNGDYLHDYNGNEINYNKVFIYKPSTGKYYHRTNFRILTDGKTQFDEYEVPSNFSELMKAGASMNNILTNKIERTTSRPVNTNYELWDLFGGAYSAHINPDTLELEYANDNTSLENVYIASYNVGTVLGSGQVITDEDVYLPIRDSKIDWVVTQGAIKHGATNVNYGGSRAIEDPNYKLTTQKMSTADVGMQLNPEHIADKSTLTLMTQVINALGLRGYSNIEAHKCYKALESLTNICLKEVFEGIGIDVETGNSQEFKDAVATIVLKSLANTSPTGGDLLSAIVAQLDMSGNVEHAYDVIRSKLPVSDPAIMHKFISNINATMTKAGIRIPMQGIMDVLVPSDGIYKIHGGKIRNIANTSKYPGQDSLITLNKDELSEKEFELQQLKVLQEEADTHPLQLHEITIGASYYIQITSPDGEVTKSSISTKIDDKFSYYRLRDKLKDYVDAGFKCNLIEDVIKGRELSSYDAQWRDTKGFNYKLWDLESTYYLTNLLNGQASQYYNQVLQNPNILSEVFHVNPTAINLDSEKEFVNSLQKALRANLQKDLNSIGSGNSTGVRVLRNINDSSSEKEFITIQVAKNSTKVKPYELIASKTYATTFGLRVGDDISEIVNDSNFFLKRLLENKKENVAPTDYDLALRSVSGKNYYIRYKCQYSNTNGLSNSPLRLDTEWDGNTLYRLDSDSGKRLYKIPYHYDDNHRVVMDIQVYTDVNGHEIIYTNRLSEILDLFSYSYIDFGSPTVNDKNEQKFLEILKVLETVDKNSVKNLVEAIKTSSQESNLPAINIIKELTAAKENELAKLNAAIQNKEKISFLEYSPVTRQLIASGNELHTSFLESCHYLVSRTPAQSHQSFMPMVLIGFDESGVNSAYVSRYQLYLQGSDFDVDKASLLGYVFNSGKFVTWSPFMSLAYQEIFDASKDLPFPTGNKVQVGEITSDIYDSIDKPININVWEDDYVEFEISGQIISIQNLGDNKYLINSPNYNKLNKLDKFLIKKAIWDKLPEGANIQTTISDFQIGFTKNSETELGFTYTKQGTYDNLSSFNEFIDAYADLYTKEGRLKKSPNNIRRLAQLFDILNNFGVIPPAEDNSLLSFIQRDFDAHNTYFEKHSDAKDAAINYVSSAAFKVSADPVNNIQASTSVDFQTGIVKTLANQSKLAEQSRHFDTGNEMSKFRLNKLTLSGKSDTGIEASALKVYEAEYQYTCHVLNFGTTQEQHELLSDARLLGKSMPLVANAFAKNITNIKDKDIYDILQEVDQSEDAVIWLSAFLSLSTDNAKDPTLTKINADPEMIGLYNAGFILGLPIETLIRTINSDTGRILAEVQKGNILTNLDGQSMVTGALNYLRRGPNLSYISSITSITDTIDTALQNAGLKSDNEKINGHNLISYLLGGQRDLPAIYTAKNVISALRQTIYGDSEVDVININQAIRNRLNSQKRSLNRLDRQIIGLEKVIEELKANKKSTKRLENKITKLSEDKAKLQNSIDQLVDITENLRLTGDVGTGSGDEYEYAKKLQKDIAKAEQAHSRITGTTVKGIIDNMHSFNRLLSDLEIYLNYLETIANEPGIVGENGREYNLLDVITQLNYKAQEMSLLRPLLGLNQQLPNSQEDFLAFVNNFGEIINSRKKLLGDFSATELDNFESLNESLGISGLTVDLHQFIWNPEYQKAAIAAYGSIKYQVNVLDCITKVPHYFGYLRTAEAAYRINKALSIQFRDQDIILQKIIRGDLKVYKKADVAKRLKLASAYLARRLNNGFLQRQNLTISIGEKNITLGTPEGNDAFIQWMENEVIPQLKDAFRNNEFLKTITRAAYHKADSRNTIYPYTTLVDSMSQSESEKSQYYAVQQGLTELTTFKNSKFGNIPYVDLFFYYDLICYNRQPGRSSLTPLFNSLVASRRSSTVNKYIEYVSTLDQSKLSLLGELDESLIDEIERYIAPNVSIYELNKSKEKYQFVKDPATKKNYLVRTLEKQRKSSGVPDEALDSLYDDLEADQYFSLDDLSEFSVEYSEYTRMLSLREKINNELKEQFALIDTALSRFNPYLITDNSILGFGEMGLDIQVNSNSVSIQGTTVTLDENGKLTNTSELFEKLQTLAKLNGHQINSINDIIVSKVDVTNKTKVIDVEETTNNINNCMQKCEI